MRISKTNVLLGSTPSVTTGGSLDSAANVTDPDFSTSYTGTDNNTLRFEFGARSNISYVAVAGINISGLGDGLSYVRVADGSTAVSANYIVRDNCVMITFDAKSFSNLRVKLYNAAGDKLPSVRFIAAGEYMQVPNGGENAGYNRQFLNRNIKTKSTLSNLAAPTAVLTKKIAPSGTLTLPNMTKLFTESEWQDFLDFSVNNYFFIVEQDLTGEVTQNQSAYLCFDATNTSTSAGAQTRLLNNVSISFKVFTGL